MFRSFFSIRWLIAWLAGLSCAWLMASAAFAGEPVRIGVLAFRPKPQTLAQWQPLVAALKQAIPEHDFVLEAMNLNELEEAINRRQLNFVLTNPGHYVLLSRRSGLSAPLATLLVDEGGQSTSVFGGVIFTRADRADITVLKDLRSKTIAMVGADSLGGYQMQALALKRVDIRLPQDAQLLTTGMPQDKVVETVLAGRADIGFVRTGVLEAMVREGRLDLKRLKVINRQNLPGFPVQSSTPLYPEWAFSYLPNVEEDLARQVTAALFMLHKNTASTRAMGIRGFAVPADYTSVSDLLRELRFPPFEAAPSFTLSDVGSRYRWPLLAGLAALGLILLLAMRLLLARRHLAAQHQLVLAQQAQLQASESYLRAIIEAEPECIKILDTQGNLRQMNPAGLAMIEADTLAQVIGHAVVDLVVPEHQAAFAQLHQRVLAGDSVQLAFEVMGLKGGRRWLETHAVPLQNQDEVVQLAITRDITTRKQAEEKLKLAASVFSHAREGITITDAEGCIIDVNEAFTRITGYRLDEVRGKNPRILSSGRQGKAFYDTMWADLRDKGHWYGEVWNRRKDGEVYAEMLTISAVCDAQGHAAHYVALFSDITALKLHEEQLQHIAHFDALTGLPNRVLLADRLRQGMTQAQRRGQRLAVVYLDLDGFKAINDQHGHAVGDQLLMAVATRMQQTLRDGDTLARLGGDEFVAVLIDLPDESACLPLLTRLLAAAAETVLLDDQLLQVSASLGVTFYPQVEEVDADLLLRQSDQAMYQAKMAGKNRYYLFDAARDRDLRGHHESVQRIREALHAGEFVLYYQPKVNLRSGVVTGAEALIRWQHPEQGLLSPAAFLPVIEDHPLAVDIGEWVINTALTQMALWRGAGLDLPVSVNVGARQLQQTNFVARLHSMLAAHPDIAPFSLSLEVLETSALEDLVRIAQVIEDCHAMGVLFALDDFGTGYSSLTYLKRLRVSQLKIDQSFVRDMLDDPDDLAILEGVISLAKAFRREVIAEGVETVPHGTLLLQLGCELAQGYGIARPMPANAMPGWAATWQPDPAWVEAVTE
jgi:diguanylate cyclase (GGDEF)-like protein/PAS domain S-box-containing protein